jgi:hypothetical protein
LILRKRLLASCVPALLTAMVGVGEAASREAPVSRETQATPLHTLSTANIADGGYFAWIEPAICDDDENAYFLTAPSWRDGQEPSAASGAPSPRDVVRVSSDGKKRVTFSPGRGSKFSNATELKTLAMAVDRDGALFMVVWAAWHDKAGKPEKSGQYIVSFDRKGEYRSQVEVDWHEMLINQFEVFGSGEFLLRGRRIEPAESRLAVLSGSGKLQDVTVLSGRFLDEPPLESAPQSRFDRMVRGGDGRIYVTQEDDAGQGDVVHAVSASGESERIFKLPRLSKDPPLVAWKAANDRFAASYRSDAAPGEQASHWWIAVYSSGPEGVEPDASLYGPAPGPLICYRRGGAGNRFTFLMDGTKLVTMSAP